MGEKQSTMMYNLYKTALKKRLERNVSEVKSECLGVWDVGATIYILYIMCVCI